MHQSPRTHIAKKHTITNYNALQHTATRQTRTRLTPVPSCPTYTCMSHLARTSQRNTLQQITTHCNTLQHTWHAHDSLMSHIQMHCNILQHTATHTRWPRVPLCPKYECTSHPAHTSQRSTLQQTATHCNALQHARNAHDCLMSHHVPHTHAWVTPHTHRKGRT